ncbi:uncharacterized protein TNCV_713271 [Trichonephila clavipes]|nr:uncharacterized protein TNCV_713271 [Trichonephila clavipes]
MNAAEALRVYHRNHRQRRRPCTLQALRDLVRGNSKIQAAPADNDWQLRILWTDEAYFTLNGSINTKNCVHWERRILTCGASTPLFDAKVTVWCGIAATFVLGPFLTLGNDPDRPCTCSVTLSVCSHAENYVLPELRRNALNDIVWMQDGVPPHIARSVKGSWISIFGDRIIPRYYPFPWPARSHRSDAYGFLVLGLSQITVYLCNPKTLSDLKDSIQREIELPRAMLRVQRY